MSNTNENFERITNGLTQWAKERDLLDKDPHIQFSKTGWQCRYYSCGKDNYRKFNAKKSTLKINSMCFFVVKVILQRTQGGGGGFVPGKYETLESAKRAANYWLTENGYIVIYQGIKKVYFKGNKKEYKLNNNQETI